MHSHTKKAFCIGCGWEHLKHTAGYWLSCPAAHTWWITIMLLTSPLPKQWREMSNLEQGKILAYWACQMSLVEIVVDTWTAAKINIRILFRTLSTEHLEDMWKKIPGSFFKMSYNEWQLYSRQADSIQNIRNFFGHAFCDVFSSLVFCNVFSSFVSGIVIGFKFTELVLARVHTKQPRWSGPR